MVSPKRCLAEIGGKARGPFLPHKFPNSGTDFVLELLKISIQLDKRYPTLAFSKSVFGLSTRALWQHRGKRDGIDTHHDRLLSVARQPRPGEGARPQAFTLAAIIAVVQVLEQAAIDTLVRWILLLDYAELHPPEIGPLVVIDHPEGRVAGRYAAELRGLNEGVSIDAESSPAPLLPITSSKSATDIFIRSAMILLASSGFFFQ
jgi:hypothetical protein